ncbi:MAG: hypothetical protein DBY45_01790 [Clostridiales bacterium]|nr:MAG: hypothetical protein DBY45_01790 [Clostridiales bacterium]
MKSIGKFLLLFITHMLIVVVIGIILSVIYALLEYIGIAYWMTGIRAKWSDEVAVVIVCLISYFVCSRISDKLKARKSLFVLGIVIVVLYGLSFISNIINGHVMIGYIMQMILGVVFIYSNRPVKDTI